jgi:hypothetical protein
MPSSDVIEAYREARDRYERSKEELIPRLVQVAIETVADVLPSTHQLDVFGELNEEWVPTLRIQRVLDARGSVLFDTREGHDDRAVEDTIDDVDIEYLDVLIELTGDDYIGRHTIDRPPEPHTTGFTEPSRG